MMDNLRRWQDAVAVDAVVVAVEGSHRFSDVEVDDADVAPIRFVVFAQPPVSPSCALQR